MPQFSKTKMIENFGRYVSSGKVKFFRQYGLDFVPGKREGCYLYDLEGKGYLNCHCNGEVFNLGHRHPKIIAATKMAMDMWEMGSHHFISATRPMPRRSSGRIVAENDLGSKWFYCDSNARFQHPAYC